MNQADTAWMLVATALVLLMTPALGFFYGGLVRSKNALNTLMMSFISLGFVGVAWAIAGYSLAFAPGNAVVGDLSRAFLRGVGLEPSGTIPHLLFMCYQGTFCIITAALISGAIVERMRFSAYVTFITLWALVVYAPIAHWVWGGGWLSKLGALDFAGGTVVHVNAGIAALVAVLVVGKRSDYPSSALLPHNVPFTLLGAGVLWFGWFGFNAGSALAANGIAALAFTATMLAPAGTLVVWTLLDLARSRKSTAVGCATAIVVGLVAVTPAAGYVGPMSAIALGAIAAFPSYFALVYRTRTSLDDSLDVVAAHGVGGTVGALLTGVFAQKALNGVGDGLLFGNPAQLGIQAVAVLAAIAYSGVMSFVLLKLISVVLPLRASAEDESTGLDVTQHGEEAYVHAEGSRTLVTYATDSASREPSRLPAQASTLAGVLLLLCLVPSAARAQTPATTAAANGASATPAPPPADAQPAAPPVAEPPAETFGFFRGTEVGGLVDARYTWFSTRPDGDAQFRNFDTRHNQFGLSMAQLWIAKAPTAASRAGFKVRLSVGPATTIVQSLEPGSSKVLEHVEEGFISYLAPLGKGLQFDVGKFVTQHGAEVIEAKDNWNYSRSLLFALAIPYYHSGVRASYAPSDKVTLMASVVNGWNNVAENNGGKTVGAQIAFKPTPSLSLVQNYMAGPEQADDNDSWRHLADTIVSFTVNPKLSLMGNYDYGTDTVAGTKVHWQGIAGYAKFQANKWVAFSPRFEWYDDASGFTTGAVQKLKEITGTLELKPSDAFMWRIEYRTDRSDSAVFKARSGALRKTQTSVGIGVLYSFSTKG